MDEALAEALAESCRARGPSELDTALNIELGNGARSPSELDNVSVPGPLGNASRVGLGGRISGSASARSFFLPKAKMTASAQRAHARSFIKNWPAAEMSDAPPLVAVPAAGETNVAQNIEQLAMVPFIDRPLAHRTYFSLPAVMPNVSTLLKIAFVKRPNEIAEEQSHAMKLFKFYLGASRHKFNSGTKTAIANQLGVHRQEIVSLLSNLQRSASSFRM